MWQIIVAGLGSNEPNEDHVLYDFSTLLLGNIPQRLLTDVDQVKSIDVLPDDVLLEIFDFCGEAPFSKRDRGMADTGARLSAMAKRRF